MTAIVTTNTGIFIGGGQPGGGELPVTVALDATANIAIGPNGPPLAAGVSLGGTGVPVSANVVLQGAGDPVAARVDAEIGPIGASITADVAQLPSLNIRITETPPFNVSVPSEYTLGFSLFGIELFSFVLSSELKART